jgi:predicted O-linked N-acetylglucosamine transferase (SPINDLY family)
MQGLARPTHRPANRGTAKTGQSDYHRGLALAARDDWAAAAVAFEKAVARSARDPVYWLNLAHARIRCGDLERGADAARHAAQMAPDSELSLAVAFECLNAANRHQETLGLLERRAGRVFKDPHLHFQRGEALRNLNRFAEATQAYLEALARKPDYLQAHVQLGNVFERLKLHEEARECYRTAVALGGSAVELTSAMSFQDLQACRWDLLAQDLSDLNRMIGQGLGQPVPFQMLAQPSTRAQQRAAAQAHARQMFAGVPPLSPRLVREARGGDARLRVGYLSCDFYEHATAYLVSEVLEHHDRSGFHVAAYSYGSNDQSTARRRVERAVDRFVDAQQMSDRALAEAIQADGIDILIDLKGYTLAARNRVMAFRPAPVQVNYLGYPGTLGSPVYDYIIGDATVTPLDHADGYDEKIAQMPFCYQPNDRRRAIGPTPSRSACGLPERGFVFCSFNNPYKITADVFDTWCRLLAQVDGSVLWLYESNDQARRNLAAQLAARGLAPQRLVWAPHAHLGAHLGRLQLADLVLDTRPVCGHTTASDALWAGVPVLTCPGETFVSRVAASLLEAAGLPELIASDTARYEALALALARDAARLAAMRRRLADNRDRCPLFDSARYTRDLEALFLRMRERSLGAGAPDHLPARVARGP